MSSYSLYTNKTWHQTLQDLRATLEKWGVSEFEVSGSKKTNYYQTEAERVVSIRFVHPSGRTIVVRKGDLGRAIDNFRALYLGLEDMRMMEKRGISDVVREALAQLPAPVQPTDPYQLLGVQEGAPRDVIDAAYRAQAKRLHPDAGGTDTAMRALNEAYEIVKRSLALSAGGVEGRRR